MFLWDWLKNIMDYLGPFFGKKKATLLLLGLDDAGKTTLLGRLKDDRLTQPMPTALPSSESLCCGNVTFTTYDLGGHRQVRRVWKTYLPVADGILFILDGADRERFLEAKTELDHLLGDEEVVHVPIAVLVNKIDIHGAANDKEVSHYFGLEGFISGKDVSSESLGKRPLEVFNCSLVTRQGYGAAIKWVAQQL